MHNENKPASNQQYWKNVEAFIQQANELAAEQGMDSVSSGLLFAAARFSAFNAATKYNDAEQLNQDKEEAVKYFTSLFRKMFDENMEEYSQHFDSMIQQKQADDA